MYTDGKLGFNIVGINGKINPINNITNRGFFGSRSFTPAPVIAPIAPVIAPIAPVIAPAYVPVNPTFATPNFINSDVKAALPAGITAQADYTKDFKEANPLIFGVSQTAALAYGAGLLVLFLLLKKPKGR